MVALLGRSSWTVFLYSIFTGFGASYELNSSWTPSWPGPRADTSWALFSLYKVNYAPGGCHSLYKWGKPEMKPYHKIMCQHRDKSPRKPCRAQLLALDGRLWMAAAWPATATGSARADETHSESAGVAGVALSISEGCLLSSKPQFEDNLWPAL